MDLPDVEYEEENLGSMRARDPRKDKIHSEVLLLCHQRSSVLSVVPFPSGPAAKVPALRRSPSEAHGHRSPYFKLTKSVLYMYNHKLLYFIALSGIFLSFVISRFGHKNL